MPSLVAVRHGRSVTASLFDVVDKERALALLAPRDSGSSDEIPVLVEWRTGFKSTSSMEEQRYCLDQLVCALSQMSAMPATNGSGENESFEAISFGVLQCLGWVTIDRDFSRVGLVFRFPDHDISEPRSLYERIRANRRSKTNTLALGARFSMAVQLVKRVAIFDCCRMGAQINKKS